MLRVEVIDRLGNWFQILNPGHYDWGLMRPLPEWVKVKSKLEELADNEEIWMRTSEITHIKIFQTMPDLSKAD